jgi:hypothetical protein
VKRVMYTSCQSISRSSSDICSHSNTQVSLCIELYFSEYSRNSKVKEFINHFIFLIKNNTVKLSTPFIRLFSILTYSERNFHIYTKNKFFFFFFFSNLFWILQYEEEEWYHHSAMLRKEKEKEIVLRVYVIISFVTLSYWKWPDERNRKLHCIIFHEKNKIIDEFLYLVISLFNYIASNNLRIFQIHCIPMKYSIMLKIHYLFYRRH